MKVCLINNLYPPYSRGGAEYVVFKTVRGMLEEGHEVVVITTSPEGEDFYEEAGLKIYRYLPSNLFFYTQAHKHNWLARFLWHLIDMFHFSSATYVRRILEKERPKVVHTHNLMGMSFLIPRVIRKLGVRHLHTVHDVQLVEPSGIILKDKENSWRYNGLPTKIYTQMMKKLMGSPNVVISPSQFLLDFYKKRGFFSLSKQVVLRNPVAIESFEIIKKTAENLRFLYLGQIEEHKGVVFLVDSFIELLGVGKISAELHIAGDGAQFKKIKKLAALYDKIVFHGKVDRDELSNLFVEIDMTIVPSLCYENSPTVIFESLSFGVPVLASRVEGVEELIREGENGLTFDTGNKESLISKIRWCIENKNKLSEMSKNASKSLVGLSLDDYIGKLDGLYKK